MFDFLIAIVIFIIFNDVLISVSNRFQTLESIVFIISRDFFRSGDFQNTDQREIFVSRDIRTGKSTHIP